MKLIVYLINSYLINSSIKIILGQNNDLYKMYKYIAMYANSPELSVSLPDMALTVCKESHIR